MRLFQQRDCLNLALFFRGNEASGYKWLIVGLWILFCSLESVVAKATTVTAVLTPLLHHGEERTSPSWWRKKPSGTHAASYNNHVSLVPLPLDWQPFLFTSNSAGFDYSMCRKCLKVASVLASAVANLERAPFSSFWRAAFKNTICANILRTCTMPTLALAMQLGIARWY